MEEHEAPDGEAMEVHDEVMEEQQPAPAEVIEKHEWTYLPEDLLRMILDTKTLCNTFDHLRHRSVCTEWRGNTAPGPMTPISHFPNALPPLSEQSPFTITHLEKRMIFLLAYDPRAPWLFKITQTPNGKTLFLHPFVHDLPMVCGPLIPSHVLNFLDLPILHLSDEYVLRYSPLPPSAPPPPHGMKAAVAFIRDGGYMLLSTSTNGNMILFCSDDTQWTTITEDVSYQDVCVFRDRVCAVDKTSRTVAVARIGHNFSQEVIAGPLIGGRNTGRWKNYLVETLGKLILVRVQLSQPPQEG